MGVKLRQRELIFRQSFSSLFETPGQTSFEAPRKKVTRIPETLRRFQFIEKKSQDLPDTQFS